MSLLDDPLATDAASRLGGSGFHRPKAWGFTIGPFVLGPIGSAIAAAASFAVMVSLMTPVGLPGALTILVGTALLLAVATYPDRHGKTWLQRRGHRIGYRSGRRRGSTLYTPSALNNMGSHKLPGVLAASQLTAAVDETGSEFAIVSYPRAHYHSVSVAAAPDGASLLDPDDLVRQVGAWGGWLSTLPLEPDLLQVAVTLETSPNSGPLMHQAVRGRKSDRAHPLAVDLMDQVLDRYPRGSQGIRTSATATFKAPSPDVALDGTKVPRRDRVEELEQVRQLLSIRLPHMFADLPDTGAGRIRPLTADDVIEQVRVAYNPADRDAYDAARAQGSSRPVTLWSNAGPAGSEEHWNWYSHGGGASVTWEFTGFTTEPVFAESLLPLLETNGLNATTRITIIYRPVDLARSAVAAERNYRAAEGRVRDTRKPTAVQAKQVVDADKAREGQAHGHALLDFAILVTTTVRDPADLPRVKATIGRLGPNARLHLRSQDGLQAPAFAQGVGVLGLVTDRHLRLPTALTNGM